MADSGNNKGQRREGVGSENRRTRANQRGGQIRKRATPRQQTAQNHIYINNKSNFKSQLSRCEEVLRRGEKEVVVEGLGGAVRRTVNLALQLEEKYGGLYRLDVYTHTVTLVDDIEPENLEDDYETQTRMNSAVRIRIFKPDADKADD